MEYDVILEYDPGTRHYTATVAGIPEIIVDAKRQTSAVKLAREAIQMYLDDAHIAAASRTAKPSHAKVVAVEV
jgi:predicted RNase H-like HicB family nuclease